MRRNGSSGTVLETGGVEQPHVLAIQQLHNFDDGASLCNSSAPFGYDHRNCIPKKVVAMNAGLATSITENCAMEVARRWAPYQKVLLKVPHRKSSVLGLAMRWRDMAFLTVHGGTVMSTNNTHSDDQLECALLSTIELIARASGVLHGGPT